MRGSVLAWVLTLIALVGAALIPIPNHRVKRIRLNNAHGRPLRVLLYHPEGPVREPAPARFVVPFGLIRVAVFTALWRLSAHFFQRRGTETQSR